MKFNFSKTYSNKRLNDKVLKLLNKNVSINNTCSEENIKKKIKLCDKPNELIYILKKEAKEREISLKIYSSYWISELFYEEKLWENFFNTETINTICLMIDHLDETQSISINILYKNIIENIRDKSIQHSYSSNYINSPEYSNYIINVFLNVYQFYIEIPHIFNFKNFIFLWLENQISLYNSLLILFTRIEEQIEKDSLKQSLLNGIYRYKNILLYTLQILISKHEFDKKQEYIKILFDNLINYPIKLIRDFNKDLNNNNTVKLFIHQIVLISICNQKILSIEEKKDFIIHICKKLCKTSKSDNDDYQNSKSFNDREVLFEAIIKISNSINLEDNFILKFVYDTIDQKEKSINYELIFSLLKTFISTNIKNSLNSEKMFNIINQKFEKVLSQNIETEEDYLNFKTLFYVIIIYFIEKKKNGEEDNEFEIWFNNTFSKTPSHFQWVIDNMRPFTNMLYLLICYIPIECSKSAYHELKSMIPNIKTEDQKSFVIDYCENVENKFKEMGFSLTNQKGAKGNVIENEIQEYIEYYNNNFTISKKLISRILFKNKWYINMFLPNLLDIGRITTPSQVSLMNDERKRFILALNEYGEIQEKARISKFLWNTYLETHLSTTEEKEKEEKVEEEEKEEIPINENQKNDEKNKETDRQEEDNFVKIKVIKNKINKIFEDFIQYLSSKNISKIKMGIFSNNSSINSSSKNIEGSSNYNLIELNIIGMCNKLKGLFDQYIHYKYNMSRKLVQGQSVTENSFIIGQLNINKSYMYYRKDDKQLCFSRTFSFDEMEFVENLIERFHELIHCVTNDTNKEFVNFILFKVIKLLSNYPIIHPLIYIRLMLLLYDQIGDINEGLCDSLSRIISIMSSINYGFPDIPILHTNKSNLDDNSFNIDKGDEIGNDFLKEYIDDNIYTMTEKIKPIEVLLNPYLNNLMSLYTSNKFNYKEESIFLRIACGILYFMKSQSASIHLLSHDNDIKSFNISNIQNKEDTILFYLPEELICRLEYLNQKLKFSSTYLFEKDVNFLVDTRNNIQNYINDNDTVDNKMLLYSNIKILKSIFSYSSLNLNYKAISINQWIFWQYMNFNQWLTLEEEMEYMRSLIYGVFLNENYSTKEVFDLAQFLLLELVKFELLNEKELNVKDDIYCIDNESKFSKLLLNLISELILEAWDISQLNNDDNDYIFHLNWLNECLSNLLKFSKKSD
ncbi:hypothetical protein BCR36DRAFT_366947 [Piromyces finnis]|uniref:Uncharacterized protein n=1 Tax=Piromyces finnis TaxID=1754191 RepID=A0A1Y1VJ40_9FUNG|nr:hypothetical protein BCR36DRAFT_366947 [Piromyces finnis]|eukprot:ORX57740.1 hypothetical protein BCR36DRAFT_366947 [Piromyces finnis]